MRHSRKWQVFVSFLAGLCISLNALAQVITINGKVVDTDGQPVVFANVLQQGTTNGTNTNMEGKFTLKAPRGAQLKVSYIGYKTQVVPAEPNMQIVLEEDATLLQEAVVIGYGTVKKSDATGSILAIKPDEMNKGLTTNAQDMMQGKMPGVSVISDGGTPGGSATIRIRGGSSLNASNDPLVVIDGLAMDNDGVKGLANPLSMINPNDIESFTILKDASATAIYGSRGSNGVIIITTKKGRTGQNLRVSYSGNISLSTLPTKRDVLTGDEYRALIAEKFGTSSTEYAQLGSANTDWQDLIFRSPVSHDHNITLTGGYKNMPYRISLGYTNNEGIVKTSSFERFTAAVNLSPTFFDNHLKVNANIKGMIANNRYADGDAIGAANLMDPTQSVYVDNAEYVRSFGGYFQWTTSAESLNDNEWKYKKNDLATNNPVSVLDLKDDRSKAKSLVGNLELDYKLPFFPAINLHMNAGMDLSSGKQTTNVLPTSPLANYYGSYGWEEVDKYNLSFNTYAQYNKDFNEVHHFDVMAGYEWQHFHRESNNMYWGFYPSTNKLYPGQVYNKTTDFWKSESYLVSFFGRANLNLYNRYLLTATLRRDGSSRFGKDNRWGTFPAFAFAWKLKEESFLKPVTWLSDLKLRLGYGETGQQNFDEAYVFAQTYTMNQGNSAYYPITTNGQTLRPNAYADRLKWETTTTYNVGFDVAFLNNRITSSIDYYFRKTKDLINFVYVPAMSTFNSQSFANIGTLENSGLEFNLSARAIEQKDFTWELGYNLSWNKNKITSLTDSRAENYYVATGDISAGTGLTIQAHKVGHPASSFYVYQQVYGTDGQPLQNVYVDRNGDGIISDDDRYIYKKPAADVLMGLTSKWIYKAWDLGLSFRASINNYVYNDNLAGNSDMATGALYSSSFFSNRTPEAVALGFQSYTNETYRSDYFVQNASFLKLDNITVGYSFNKIGGWEIGGRLSASVQNVFTITKYDGLDPEVNGGIDNNLYPRPRIFMLGLNLNF